MYGFFLSLSNMVFMYRHTKKPVAESGPMVSVLLPVRDEERHIGACLRSLANQTYDNYEVIVLDDNSCDSSWDIITAYAKRHHNVHPIRGNPLPEGWNGKNFALQQLAEAANGSYLLLTDADTLHSKDSVSFAVTQMETHKVDMVSGHPKQLFSSITNGAVVSAMSLSLLFLFPLWLQKRLQTPLLGFAIGQYICIKAEVLQTVGGYSRFPMETADDICLARVLLSHGFQQLFLDVGEVVSCSMYDSFRESFSGISRSITAFFGKQFIIPMLAVPILVLLLVVPVPLLILQCVNGLQPPFLLLVGTFAMYTGWVQLNLFLRYPIQTLFLFTPSMLLVMCMGIRGFFAVVTRRGYQWKERTVR
ncbi:MAG: glycosyltransferase [Spirochaetota bacterium]